VIGHLDEALASIDDDGFKLVEGAHEAIRRRFAHQRPEPFGRLQLG
jgi:hypothetical protein